MASNLSHGMKRVLSGVMALLVVAGGTSLPANVRGGGLFARSAITAKAVELSGGVRLNKVKEGDIIGPDVEDLSGVGYTIVLKGGGYCYEWDEVGESDHSMGVNAENNMPLWRWINHGMDVSAFEDEDEDDNYVRYYPYYNGAKVDSWRVVSVEGSTITLTGYAETQSNNPFTSAVNYRQYNESGELQDNGTLDANAGILIESDTKKWTDGKTYVASGEVVIDSRVKVTGTVNLILLDGASLTINGGISVASSVLNIFVGSTTNGTITGSGSLTATGSDSNAGIGCSSSDFSSGNVNIHGGTITATGGNNCAGIGGTVNIYDGTVTANGGDSGAGIGGNYTRNGSTVNIYSGTVTANGGQAAAGIGGGLFGEGGSVHIYGGTVIATGGERLDWDNNKPGNGIGRGNGWDGEEIDNGTLTIAEGLSVFTSTDNDTWTDTTGNLDTRTRYMKVGVPESVTYTHYAAVAPTCTTAGNIEYYLGSDGNYYSNDQGTLLTDQNGDNVVDEKDVVIAATGHEFTYQASENVLTATCTHGCDEYGEGVQLTIAPLDDLTYNGSEKGAALSGLAAFNNATGSEISAENIVYKQLIEGEYQNIDNVPTDAGSYRASLTVEGQAISVTYSIAKADLVEGAGYTVPTGITATYGDTLANVELPEGWAWDDALDTLVGDAGERTFSATFTPDDTNNFNTVTEDVTVTVGKASLNPSVSVEGWTYGETQNVPNISGISDLQVAVIGVPQITGELWKYNGTEYEKVSDATLRDIPNLTGTPLDAGTYKVKLVVDENTNYNSGAWESEPFVVAKAISSVETVPVAISGLIYDGSAHSLVESGETSDGTIVYSLEENGAYSEDIPTGVGAGSYTVYYKIVGDDNHNDTEPATITVEIAMATPTADDFIFTLPENLIYNETAKEANVVFNTQNNMLSGMGDITVKYYSDENRENEVTGEPVSAGTYYVGIVVEEGTNYNAASTVLYGENWTFTINKADLAVDDFNFTPPTELAYDGNAKTASVTSEKNGVGTITVKYYSDGNRENEITGNPVNVGTYYVGITVGDSANYASNSLIYDNGWSFEITKADSSYTAPTAKTGLIYTGNAQALVTAGTASGGNMWYSLDNSNWYEDIPTGINATTYTVYYKVVGNGNHNDNNGGSVEVNIAKAAIVSSGNIANDTVWLTGDYIDFGDGAYIQSSWSPNSGKWHLTGKHKLGYGGFYTDHYWFVIEGKCDFNLNNDGESGQTVYGLTISGSGTENDPYTAVPLHMPYATVTVSTAKDLIYSGSPQLLVTEGSSNGGTVKYSLGTADVAGTEWTTDISTLTGTNANTYYVWYYVEGDANHNNTNPVCIPVTISQMSLENAVIILDKDAFDVNEVSVETPATPTVAYVIVGSTRLTEKTDYTVSYENNTSISANTPTVVITGKGNYGGTARKSFTIGTDLSDAVVTVNSTFKYNGTAKTPGVTVTYKGAVVNAANYIVSYSNNINAGTATVTITGKTENGYTGSASATFAIAKAGIASVSASGTYAYTGEAIIPTLVVKDENGAVVDAANYNVEFVNNIKAGTATIVVTAKDGTNYTGTKTGTFEIGHRYTEIAETRADCSTPGVMAHWIDENSATYLMNANNQYVAVTAANLAIPATGAHIYDTEDIQWYWTTDNSGAFAVFTCVDCGTKTNVNAVVTSSPVSGGTQYTATVTLGETEYTESKTVKNKYVVAYSEISDYKLANTTSGISFTYRNTYNGDEAVVYGFLCYREGILNEDMTVDTAGVAKITKPSATGTIGATDKGTGIYLRSYIKIGDVYVYGDQVYVKHSDLMNQKAYDEAVTEISDYKLANTTSGISFTYRNTYNGDEAVVYGFLCYREGILNEDMTVDTAGVAKITKPSATGTIGATDKGTGIYLRSYIRIGDKYKYGEQVYVKHSDLMNQKAFNEASSKITGYALANTTSGISFNYSNTYKGTEDAVYGFLCYRDGVMNEDMTVDTAGIAKITKPSATGTIGATDKGTGIYLRSYIKIGDEYKYGEQVYVKHSDLLKQKTLDDATSVITGYEIVNSNGGVKFTYKNTYTGPESAEYGFLCYREGILNEDMKVDMAGISKVTKTSATGTIGATDKGTGIYLRSYIKIGDVYVYGEQVFVRFSNQ